MKFKQITAPTLERLAGEIQNTLNELLPSPVPLHRQFLFTKAENVEDTEAWGMHEFPVRLAVKEGLVAQVYDLQIRTRQDTMGRGKDEPEFSRIGQAVVAADRDGGEPNIYAYIAAGE